MTDHSQSISQPVPDIPIPMEHSGPIAPLDRLHASLLFAQISRISYLQPEHVQIYIPRLGLELERFADRDGAQAYIFGNTTDVVVACRGTEPNDWNDVKADVNALTVVAETVGRVHRGFKREVDDLWPAIEGLIANEKRDLWFTGHSLGGAMATISAGRCLLSHIPVDPTGVYTFGAPRVGTRRYVTSASIDLTRWVNNNDMVPRVPPTWMGYRHTGRTLYLNTYGKVRRLTPRQRVKDRRRGFWLSLKKGKIDHFSDHAIADYVKHIAGNVAEREAHRRV
jgi:triacylglycerol lipase